MNDGETFGGKKCRAWLVPERCGTSSAAAESSTLKLPAANRPGFAPEAYRIYIGLGANLGDRCASLRRALRLLAHLEDTRLVRVSSFYGTPPWGETEQGNFVNAAALFRTRLLPLVLLRRTQAVERALGRVRSTHWGPRMIDIDLLYAESDAGAAAPMLQLPDLCLPHPYLAERAFVLLPLLEIAPGLTFRGKSLSSWLERLPEKGACRRICAPPAFAVRHGL